ncbi:SRPBCC domain-containing protein [Arthrobacter sp. GCM10027362]|uniref:SRPBCC family protein n=1 Tax=Arthrobacter sp. GCM10027362 TaxID=3273379 RepID=UPI00362D6581
MTESAADRELVITRVFKAPREQVYKAFTDPDTLAKWFGPVGFSVPRESMDFDMRAGGEQNFVMVSNEDPNFQSKVSATFTEVVKNERLAGTETWEDGTMNLSFEFQDEDGGTRLVLRQGPYTEEMEAMAREGWESSFTKLDALLA